MNKKKEQEESGTCVECGGVYRHASDPKKQEEWNVVLDFWQLDAWKLFIMPWLLTVNVIHIHLQFCIA